MISVRGTLCSLALVGALLLPHGASAGEDAASLLKRMEKTYDAIKDAKVAFTQHVVYGVTNAEQSFSGTLWMKKGNKYRIELEDQTIVTDGISVWSFTKSNNQVVVDKYKEDPHSFSPDKVLVNVPQRYTAAILGTEKIGGEETTILKLIPLDQKSNIAWMKLWVDGDGMMKKVQVHDISDNETTYTIGAMSVNTGVAESEFTFTAPDSVKVIDLR